MSNTQATRHLSETVRVGRRFWDAESGQALWQAERACLGPYCDRHRGALSLQLGMAPLISDMCPVRHALDWAPELALARTPQTLVCLPQRLPLSDDSVDLTVIHHLLEAVDHPNHVIQEAARVTRADGRLLVFGWHPFGSSSVPARRRPEPWQKTWRTPRRLGDWLAFVDFEIERVDYCGFSWPGQAPANRRLETLGRRYNLPLAQAYLLIARRRSIPVQPIRVRQPSVISGGSRAWSGLAQSRGDRAFYGEFSPSETPSSENGASDQKLPVQKLEVQKLRVQRHKR